MIDFKLTLKANELLYGIYEKINLASENHVPKIPTTIQNQNGITSSTKFKHSSCQRDPSTIIDLHL